MALVPIPLAAFEHKHLSRLQWVHGGIGAGSLPLLFMVAEAPEFIYINFDKFWDLETVLVDSGAVEGSGGLGPEGPPGEEGEPGIQGPPGAAGVAGVAGAQGPPGSDGEEGESGIPGQRGVDGVAGVAGVDGAMGPPGSDGEEGETGSPGVLNRVVTEGFVRQTGAGEYVAHKSNFVAVVDPVGNDDVNAGYSVASLWFNMVLGRVWQCIDASAGAAVWKDLSTQGLVPGGAGVLGRPIDFITQAWEYDDFTGGSFITGAIGKLGWQWAASANPYIGSSGLAFGELGALVFGVSAVGNCYLALGSPGLAELLSAGSMFDNVIIIKPHTLRVDVTWRAGLVDTAGSKIDPTDGMYFEKLPADVNWFAVTTSGGIETRTDTGVVADGTKRRFRMVHTSPPNTISFYIANNLVAAHTTNLFNGLAIAWLALKSTSAGIRAWRVDYWDILLTGLGR